MSVTYFPSYQGRHSVYSVAAGFELECASHRRVHQRGDATGAGGERHADSYQGQRGSNRGYPASAAEGCNVRPQGWKGDIFSALTLIF